MVSHLSSYEITFLLYLLVQMIFTLLSCILKWLVLVYLIWSVDFQFILFSPPTKLRHICFNLFYTYVPSNYLSRWQFFSHFSSSRLSLIFFSSQQNNWSDKILFFKASKHGNYNWYALIHCGRVDKELKCAS